MEESRNNFTVKIERECKNPSRRAALRQPEFCASTETRDCRSDFPGPAAGNARIAPGSMPNPDQPGKGVQTCLNWNGPV